MEDKGWDELQKALGAMGASIDRDHALRGQALNQAVKALHAIATSQSGQGLRETASLALSAVAMTLTS
jgi:hypothetical protein